MTWPPPKLDSPKTITLTEGDDALDLDSRQDYILKMPSRKKAGHLRITGGRNVVLIGGWSTMPAGRDRGEVNFLILDKPDTLVGRIVHLEGVKIDGSGGGSSDAFRINAPKTIVQLENIRATGIIFDPKIRQHSDLVQTGGGCQELRIDRFTGSSQFQGFYLAQDQGPNGRLDLRHVNLRGDGSRKIILLAIGGAINSPKTNGKRLFDLCDVPPVNLMDVYLKPSLPEDPTASVLPNGGARNPACQAKVSADGKTLDWPDLRNSVTGLIHLGDPPDGDFVPEGTVGLDYSSSEQQGNTVTLAQSLLPRRSYVPLFGLGSASRGADGFANLPPEQLEQIARHFATIDGQFSEPDARRLHELNPNIKLLPYLNSTYTSGSEESAGYERDCRAAIALCRSGVLGEALSAAGTNLLVKDWGRAKFPFLPGTAKGDLTVNSSDFVMWIRLGEEYLKVTGVDAPAGRLEVVRGFSGSRATEHPAGALLLAPVYIGSAVGSLGAGNGLPGRVGKRGVRYALQPDHPEMAGRKAQAIIRNLQSGFDGAFLDILAPGFFNQGDCLGQVVQPWNLAAGRAYTAFDWGSAQEKKIAALQKLAKEATGRKPFLVGNNMNGKYFDATGGARRFLVPTAAKPTPVDGMMSESPFSSPGTKAPFRSEDRWRMAVQELIDAAQNKLAALAYSKTAGESDTAQAGAQTDRFALFDYCSLLLAYEPDSPLQLAMPLFVGARKGNRSVNLPEHLFIALGVPEDRVTYQKLDDYKTGKHTFRRHYSNGIVLVNPSDQDDEAISLGVEYRDPKSGQGVKEVALPANTARLLILREHQ